MTPKEAGAIPQAAAEHERTREPTARELLAALAETQTLISVGTAFRAGEKPANYWQWVCWRGGQRIEGETIESLMEHLVDATSRSAKGEADDSRAGRRADRT